MKTFIITGQPLTFDFPTDVANELAFARTKFPSNRHMGLAFGEESGELLRALLECTYKKGPHRNVYREAVQAAAMAQRIAEEGDSGLSYSLASARAEGGR